MTADEWDKQANCSGSIASGKGMAEASGRGCGSGCRKRIGNWRFSLLVRRLASEVVSNWSASTDLVLDWRES